MEYVKLYEEFIREGFMSELWIYADESKNLDEFMKKARKRYPQITKTKEDDEWLEQIYKEGKEAMKESHIDESRPALELMKTLSELDKKIQALPFYDKIKKSGKVSEVEGIVRHEMEMDGASDKEIDEALPHFMNALKMGGYVK